MSEGDSEAGMEENTENTNGPNAKSKSTFTPGVTNTGNTGLGGTFSTLYNTGPPLGQQSGPSFGQQHGNPFGPYSSGPGGYPSATVNLPSCLMPESFNGSGDFEDYLQQFETAALLSGWHSNQHDHRPKYFALRLRDNALHFYTTLSEDQQNDYDLLIETFRQNYTTNVDILKARLKAAKQQPDQDITTFLCDIRTLARRAYRDNPELIDQMVLTSFVEGLKSPTLRWELRKAKPRVAEDALRFAMEIDSFIQLEKTYAPGSASQDTFEVNRIKNVLPQQDSLVELVRSLKNDVENLKRSTDNNNESRDNNRGRSLSTDRNGRGDSREQTPNRYPANSRNEEGYRFRQRSNEDRRDSRDRQSRSVRFDSSGNNNGGRNNSYNNGGSQQQRQNDRPNSPYQNKQYNQTNGRRNNNSYQDRRNEPKTQESPCRHCGRTNHSSKECKACFNCGRMGHFRRECRAPKRNQLN